MSTPTLPAIVRSEEIAAEQNSWNVFTSRPLLLSAAKPLNAGCATGSNPYAPAPSSEPV